MFYLCQTVPDFFHQFNVHWGLGYYFCYVMLDFIQMLLGSRFWFDKVQCGFLYIGWTKPVYDESIVSSTENFAQTDKAYLSGSKLFKLNQQPGDTK